MKEAIFNLRVNTGNSVNDINNFDKSVDELNKSVKDTQTTLESGKGVDAFEKQLNDLDAKLKEGNLSIRQQSKLIKEYQAIALQAGDSTPIGRRAVQSAAELKDTLADLNQRVTLLSSDTVKLDTALAGISTGAAVFQGLQSAVALTGVESEELTKTMVKLQATQGLVNAVQTVANTLNKDAILGIQLRIGFEKILGFVLGTSTTQTIALTTAQKALRVALLATGAGVVLAGISALYLAYDKWSTEQKKVADNNRILAQQAKEQRENIAKESASFGTLIARLKTTNENSKEREDLIKKINKEYGTTLKNIKDERDFQSQLNTELASYLDYQKAKYLLQRNEEKIQKNLDVQMKLEADISKGKKEQIALEKELIKEREKLKSASTFTSETKLFSDYDKQIEKINSIEKAQKENNKSLIENQKELGNAQLRFEDYGRSANDASNKVAELTNNGKKYGEEKEKVVKKEIENNKTLTEYYDALEAERQSKITDAKEKELQALDNKYQELYSKADAAGQSDKDLIAKQQIEIAEINAKYAQIEIDEALKIQKEINDRKTEAQNEYQLQLEVLSEQNRQMVLTEQQLEIEAVNEKYFELEELAKDNAEELAIIQTAKANELNEINIKYQNEEIELAKKTKEELAKIEKEKDRKSVV
jgi:hypothetical protein